MTPPTTGAHVIRTSNCKSLARPHRTEDPLEKETGYDQPTYRMESVDVDHGAADPPGRLRRSRGAANCRSVSAGIAEVAESAAAQTDAPSAAPSASAATASPSPALSAAPEASGKALRIRSTGLFPDTLDPHLAGYVNEIGVVGMAYEGLTRLSSDLKASPAAAEGWEFNASGDEITFTLRPDLVYSDGSPLHAERFRDALVRSCDPSLAATYTYILFDVAGCEAFASTPVTDTAALETARQALRDAVGVPDERTLVIKLTHSAPYFPYIAGLWVLYPVKQELIEAGGADWWREASGHVGNGPFTITDVTMEERVAFAPNERYWDGAPQAEAVEYLYIKDSAVALQAYQAGQLDIIGPGFIAQLPVIDADEALRAELIKYTGANAYMIQFNLSKEPFNDIHVRKAFAYAWDRETACTVIENGACVPSLSWVPPGIDGSIETDAYAFDPDKARAELAASSYGSADKLPPITLTYVSGDPAVVPRMEWMAQQYREVLGASIELEPLEIGSYMAVLSDNATFPQMTIGGWIQDYPDPQNWLGNLLGQSLGLGAADGL